MVNRLPIFYKKSSGGLSGQAGSRLKAGRAIRVAQGGCLAIACEAAIALFDATLPATLGAPDLMMMHAAGGPLVLRHVVRVAGCLVGVPSGLSHSVRISGFF